MMRAPIGLLAAMCLLAAASTVTFATEQIPLSDNFEEYGVGSYAPFYNGDINTWGDSATTQAPNRYSVIETSALDGNPANQVAHVVDVIGVADTKNTHLRTNFTPLPVASGTRDVTMDIKPLQENGPFKVVMTNWNGWTSAFNWVASVAFGSSAGNTFFPGMTAGAKFGLETTTTAWVNTTVAYTANTWYTLKFSIDITNLKYRAFVGPHGGSLTELTSGPTSWITGAGTPPTVFGGMYVATSNKTNEGAQLLLDNVVCSPEPSSIAAFLCLLGLIPAMRLRRR